MQLIFVYIILLITIAYIIYVVVMKYFRKKNSDLDESLDNDPCANCNGCDLKKEITKNLKNKPQHNPQTCGHNRKKQ